MSNHQDKLDKKFNAEEGRKLLDETDNGTDALRVAVIATRNWGTEKEEWKQIKEEADKLAADFNRKEFE